MKEMGFKFKKIQKKRDLDLMSPVDIDVSFAQDLQKPPPQCLVTALLLCCVTWTLVEHTSKRVITVT